jgi:hypothetical protein
LAARESTTEALRRSLEAAGAPPGQGSSLPTPQGRGRNPSDLYGVIYKEMDAAEGWKLKLLKELNAAGLDFDPKKLLT